jgi:hypothetical protein
MSYGRYISLLKELQTKPLSINIDRKGVNFVVFAFSEYQTCKLALPYGIKHESTKMSKLCLVVDCCCGSDELQSKISWPIPDTSRGKQQGHRTDRVGQP